MLTTSENISFCSLGVKKGTDDNPAQGQFCPLPLPPNLLYQFTQPRKRMHRHLFLIRPNSPTTISASSPSSDPLYSASNCPSTACTQRNSSEIRDGPLKHNILNSQLPRPSRSFLTLPNAIRKAPIFASHSHKIRKIRKKIRDSHHNPQSMRRPPSLQRSEVTGHDNYTRCEPPPESALLRSHRLPTQPRYHHSERPAHVQRLQHPNNSRHPFHLRHPANRQESQRNGQGAKMACFAATVRSPESEQEA